MSKKMLINASHPEENRVAIVKDGILTELDIEIEGKEQTKGNIYKAVVVRVESGLQAAFVDYGGERLGFLQMGEIHPNYYRPSDEKGENRGRPRINDILQRGQELLVQIVKEERGTKGAALTTYLSLPGRYMVLMPESNTKGISRKIEDDSERKGLKKAMASLDLPDNVGFIVRTAGIGQSSEELKRDFDYLLRVYKNIQNLADRTKAPALIYKESNLIIRSIRDYFSADIDEVLVDDTKVFHEAKEFFQQVMPEYARLVRLHNEKRPIFARYQIEEQIEGLSSNKVLLTSGGSIVIDSTEALVAIDVNSGKMASEQGVEATAYKTNLEAATEAGRQLRLRDLGGLVVIDFIDMRDRKHIREVENNLKAALKDDKARVTVGRISSQFGLLEMSRQRIKATLAEGAYLACPHCNGTGHIKSIEAQSVAVIRKIQSGIAKGQIGRVEGEIPLDVATYLLNTRRDDLLAMERQHKLEIFVQGSPSLAAGLFELNFIKREKEEQAQPEFVDPLTAISLPEPETAEVEAIESLEEGETSAGEAEGAEDAPKKRRRRRRRRKKTAESGETTAEETGAGEADHAVGEPAQMPPVVPSAGTEVPAAAEAAPVDSASSSEQASTEASAEVSLTDNQPPQDDATRGEKPSRPRRRRRRKPHGHRTGEEIAENDANEAVSTSPVADADTEAGGKKPESAGVSESGPDQTAEKPTAPEPPGISTAKSAFAAEAVTQEQPVLSEPATDMAPETGEEAPSKPKARSRSRARKATTEATVEESATETPAPAATEAVKKPTRAKATRSRKKPAVRKEEAPIEAASQEAAEPGTAPAPVEAAAQEPPQPKPARSRSRARKPKAEAVEAEAQETANPAQEPSSAQSEPAKEVAAKPKAPRKRAAPKKKAAEEPMAEAPPAAEAPQDTGAEPQPEPAKAAPKKRAPRKKAAPASAEGESVVATGEEAPKKPARKTTARKKTAETEPAESTETSGAKPRKTPARSRAKKTGTAAEATTEEPKTPAPRKRAARKKPVSQEADE